VQRFKEVPHPHGVDHDADLQMRVRHHW
jgi:hypothetical protein